MGDMADFALEEVMDFEDARTDYRRGELTHEEAVEAGVIDDATGAEYPERGE